MWYFCWILGVLLACSVGVINALRLEAQEALVKESIDIDPLAQFLAKETVLQRLQEKLNDTKRRSMPFSLIYMSFNEFKSRHQLKPHEIDRMLVKVIALIKNDIRIGLDVVARTGDEEFVLARPGAQLKLAENIASRIKHNIFVNIVTSEELAVDAHIGFAEFVQHMANDSSDNKTNEIEILLNKAMKNVLS